ncbi:MAG: sulfurtransferase TusA family protein [Gammaproteobacteria bacterium]|nr:sulfurtransferase TusA family protein [Gammaproteobacteria bacterium]
MLGKTIKRMTVFLGNLFHWKDVDTSVQRHRSVTRINESVELPGYGLVQIGCRVECESEGCPRPQLLTLKALNDVDRGVVVEVVTDNLSVVETMPSMMDIYEGVHLATVQGKDNWCIYVRREI